MFLDTDIVVDALRGFPPALTYLDMAEQQGMLAISIPPQLELLIGCRNRAELQRVEEFVERFEIRNLSATIGETAVDLVRQYRLSHGLLLADAMIAATALTNNETLYTKNIRHFQMIPGLRIIRPY